MSEPSRRNPLRIAFARINQETNALSPVTTSMADFRAWHLVAGSELRDRCRPLRAELPGFVRNAELSGFVSAARAASVAVEVVPLISAWAIPSGPVERATLDELMAWLLRDLAHAGPIDGLFLSLHGAMRAVDSDDPEVELLRAIRAQVGPELPIAASFDLHAHISDDKLEHLDIVGAYRTNPHRDHARTGRRVGALLIDMIRGAVRPVTAWRSLPMVAGGGTTLDFLPTMRPIFRRLKEVERHPRVLYASLFMCHPWNDAPDLGWSVVVVTDGDPDLADTIAEELADAAWAVRDVPTPAFVTIDAAIDKARKARWARRLGAVILCDASDVVAAGAPGENTRIVAALLQQAPELVSYVPLRAPEIVKRLWTTPPGAAVPLTVGGELQPGDTPPLDLTTTVVSRHELPLVGRVVVGRVGNVWIVFTEGAAAAVKPSFFTRAGLNPLRADIVVVKSFFPFLIYFLPYARKVIYVKTEGATDLDAALNLPFDGPVHPIERLTDWRPADRRRRRGAA